ncbi:MAG: hypothetical protein NT157_00230, partial [Candidatus Micrarchaeota archaeon]|nr:hypothetical protein [Candidatus Micrarchaeota archaeon]
MKTEVVCYSMTGRTRKIAGAIAQEFGVEAKTPEQATGECDILFLGSGNYGNKCGKTMEEFIGKLKPSKYPDIYLFATWGGERKVLDYMAGL